LTVLFAVGLQLTGARSGLVAVAVGLAVAASKHWRRAVVLLVATAVGLGLGGLLASPGAAKTGTERLLLTESEGGLRPRAEAWASASHAVADRPIFGAGPGRFGAAAGPYRTLAFVRAEGPGRVFLDAHDIIVEYAVTTGLPGVALFLAWVILALRRAGIRSPLGAAAGGMLLVHLVEPQSVTTTPLAFLLLGAAGPPLLGALRRPARLVVALSSAVGAACAATLGYGLFALNQAALDYHEGWAETADRVLPIWGEPQAVRGRIAVLRAIETRDRRYTYEALRLRRAASEADPTDEVALETLATFEAQLNRRDAAKRDFARLLELDPWESNALNILGRMLAEEGETEQALVLLRRAVEVYPDQPGTRALIARLEVSTS
jgi:hypothetical protein